MICNGCGSSIDTTGEYFLIRNDDAGKADRWLCATCGQALTSADYQVRCLACNAVFADQNEFMAHYQSHKVQDFTGGH